MVKKLLLLFAIPYCAFAQDNYTVINNGPLSAGIRKIVTADFNNDGYTDILTVSAFNVDSVVLYLSNEGNSFTQIVVDDTLDEPYYAGTGDFNNDGWTDVAVITQNSGQLYFYLNNNGTLGSNQLIDDDFNFGNGLTVADFDGNGFDDIVGIGQHSIDFYRNNGIGGFIKEHILTTATSPNILECMHIDSADMNNDGFKDLVVAETLGGVVYFNNGNGVFTPQLFSNQPLAHRLVHLFDYDNDGDQDAALMTFTGTLRLYSNNGSGTMTLEGDIVLSGQPQIRSLVSPDVNNDGIPELFTAHGSKAWLMVNNNSLPWQQLVMGEATNIFISDVAMADLNNDNIPELIWSGVNNTLAYRQMPVLNTKSFIENSVNIYPNPVENKVNITGNEEYQTAVITNLQGQKVTQTTIVNNEINLDELQPGVYFLQALSSTGNTVTKKIIKQ